VKIAKIKGIEIRLHLSTLLIIALVGFYAASLYAALIPNASIIELITVGLINGIIILASILTHELSHSIIAQRNGLEVTEIELHLFGGVSRIEEEPHTPRAEILIAIVGPLSSLLIGIILLVLFYLPLSIPTFLVVTFFYSGISNIGLGIFNLLPAFPIDGGRVLRAFLWNRRKNIISATKTTSRIGVGFGYGLMIYGLFQMFTFGLINGIWLILIGSFLRSTARNSYLQTVNDVALSNVSVKEMLFASNLRIPFGMLITDAVREFFIPYQRSYFPVIQGDEIKGIVHIADIKKIPLQQRSSFIIGYIMRKISEFPLVDGEETGKEVMKKLNKIDDNHHIVIVKEKDNNTLLGFIGEEDVISYLKFWNLNIETS
jgi:Zn-dependent protease